MKTKKQLGNTFEEVVVQLITPIDKYARRTRGSGNGNEIGDVSNKYFYIECKKRSTKHITIKQDVWYKLCASVTIGSNKTPIYCLENSEGDQFAVLDLKTFFKEFVYPKYKEN